MTVTDHIRQHALQSVGYTEPQEQQKPLDLEALRQSEWSPEFETLMRNRLLMGAFRYGVLNAPNKPEYNRTESIIKRVMLYEETGNVEYLVDAANLCLVEFVEGAHPDKHMDSIDDGIHVQTK